MLYCATYTTPLRNPLTNDNSVWHLPEARRAFTISTVVAILTESIM